MNAQWLILLAELALRQEEQKPGYSLQLLQITASGSYPYNTRLASALCFKNFIKRNYTDEDGNYKLQLDEVTTIKQELISLMISVPAGIQTQLGEAVSVIADSDFWERWDTLVDVSSHCEENSACFPPSIDTRRISSQDSNQKTLQSTTVSYKLPILSSSDGGLCSDPMIFIQRSIMFWVNSETLSWLSSRYDY